MNELALFAGAGGGILASQLLDWRCVCAVEKDAYCREVLLRRQEEGHIGPFPIWDDIRTFNGKCWSGLVDVVSAGFPCQPWSVAGQRKGEADDRNLWPDTIRVIREVEPEWCLLENVPGLLHHAYVRRIFGELAALGYDCRWGCISATSQGAHHIRNRLWIVAHAGSSTLWNQHRRSSGESGKDKTQPGDDGKEGFLADAMSIRRPGRRSSQEASGQAGCVSAEGDNSWPPEPNVGRVAHGVAYRVDRLKALGNGQVPRVVLAAWRLLT